MSVSLSPFSSEDAIEGAHRIDATRLVWEIGSSTGSFVLGASGKVHCFFACAVAQGRRRRGQRMAADYSICLGTAGWGVWHSPDAGKSWTRHRAPFPLNTRIQALVAHPTDAQTVFAGGDTGLFVSHDGGARW